MCSTVPFGAFLNRFSNARGLKEAASRLTQCTGRMSSSSTTSDPRSGPCLRDIHRLISECHVVLQTDPSCLHTRAVRGHACMKAKQWEQAIRDFSEILRCRPDDVHGRFSRGMALFKSGRVDDAHRDFSHVLELNPNHVMARYARAGCYNSEGEFNQAIQEYTLALQHDEKENTGGFRAERRRIGMHESAEHLIRKTLGISTRLRCASLEQSPQSESKSLMSVLERVVNRHPTSMQEGNPRPRSESVTGKRPRKIVQKVRVNLNELAQTSTTAPQQLPHTVINLATASVSMYSEVCRTSCSINQTPPQQTQTSRVLAVRAVPKTVRRVTVSL